MIWGRVGPSGPKWAQAKTARARPLAGICGARDNGWPLGGPEINLQGLVCKQTATSERLRTLKGQRLAEVGASIAKTRGGLFASQWAASESSGRPIWFHLIWLALAASIGLIEQNARSPNSSSASRNKTDPQDTSKPPPYASSTSPNGVARPKRSQIARELSSAGSSFALRASTLESGPHLHTATLCAGQS